MNKEIDHLYSLSTSSDAAPQNVGQFSVNSIRMKSSLGLAGKAFTSGKIQIDPDASKHLISEEKDTAKLKVQSVKNAVAVPVLDKQNGAPLAVVMIYNYDEAVFESQGLSGEGEQRLLWDFSNLVSSVIFNVENLQGVLADNDLLGAQFNCINEGVVLLNAELCVTKINKSAEILLNATSATTVGRRITEILGSTNNHLMKPISE